MDALILDNIRKSFGSVRAVDGVSAQVPPGCVYGLLGPNGAGKTTTIRMIMNIIRPDSGRIQILDTASATEARRRTGYMPEERGLYPKMTLRGVLTYLGGIAGVRRDALERAIPQWLDRMGLKDWARRKVEELSKGMQQKAQFIACVLHEPELLILDEPFAGLDPINQDVLQDLILAMRQAGKTIILSTHNMAQAERLCDGLLLINRGRKVLDGPLQDIRARYHTNVVSLEADGATDFIAALPMVERVGQAGKRLEITLNAGASSQDLLAALVHRVHVRVFEEKSPTLHEIFVRLVGSDHGQDSQSRVA
ncbi:MAG: ATP-binding cassette domain-containing protein [Planctomycetes bacterium]|nr:ATP-binding cassette domain-containing protein [Planctomycetota bacterium]